MLMNVLLTFKDQTEQVKKKPLGAESVNLIFYTNINSATFQICIIFTFKYQAK